MPPLEYRTAGESHGKSCVVFIEGMPAGINLDMDRINGELVRRQGGYGRGGRQRLETDSLDILSGIRCGKTIGSPIAGLVANKDFRIDTAPPVTRPRPGHADLPGSLKWLTTDCRETLERASARETASRVAAGAVARCLLDEFGIEVVGFVSQIGAAKADVDPGMALDELKRARDASEVYCPDSAASDAMIAEIKKALHDKDSIGGIVEVRACGLPPGIGSSARWQDKLDGRLAAAIVSIQAFKGAEIGGGFELGGLMGSQVHDAIYFDPAQRNTPNLGFVRKTNRAGGLEGGMTNGQPVVVRGIMKPIATLMQGMDSVDLISKQAERSDYERSDACATPAASVVAENAVAFELAKAFLEKFAGDTLGEVKAAYEKYLELARQL